MFFISVLFVSLITALIPQWIQYIKPYLFPKLKFNDSPKWLPRLAGFLFFIAFFIPDIHISTHTTTFQQHFVGGGIYCTLLFIYFKKLLGWHFNWLSEMLVLFAWTSAFGVANELLEFTVTELHLGHISTGDTDWDLLANTLGALFSYLVYKLWVANRN
jgi:hypothetical protein